MQSAARQGGKFRRVMDTTAISRIVPSMSPRDHPSVSPSATTVVRMVACAAMLLGGGFARVQAQQPTPLVAITRDSAISLALAHGSRAAIANATARSAAARVREAGMFANPLLIASYSKSLPQYHASVDFPLDFLTLRNLRIAAARSTSEAAQLRLEFERAAIRLDADTSYTLASARRARARLSLRNAMDADSLLTIAEVRRSAGDASDLDVDVARISAGRARNLAAADSQAAVAATLELQQALGLPVGQQTITVADSLDVPRLDTIVAPDSLAPNATPLSVAAAQRDLQAAERTLALERRNIWSGLALQAGIENHDPTGAEPGILPTVGVSIPLPLFNQGQGAVAVAQAERDRARAELAAAQRGSAALIARARSDLIAASQRVARDRQLVETANRVARLSLQAYVEGSYPLTTVLEAQRNARDTLAELIDDLVAANTAAAALRLYTGVTTK
ncbi:MAG: outer rane efflux protein [Gemmatimonadetes bacterium]|nr:outer rane efflux protein [Gemmatimonadota bacterium]